MRCPIEGRDGVHDCTNGSVCPCGMEFKVPRFGFSVEVYDNDKPGMDKDVANDGFNCKYPWQISERLREIADEIEKLA